MDEASSAPLSLAFAICSNYSLNVGVGGDIKELLTASHFSAITVHCRSVTIIQSPGNTRPSSAKQDMQAEPKSPVL